MIAISLHNSETLQSRFFIEAYARRTWDFVSLKERPPFRPLALAAARPANIPNMSFPLAVVVSISAPCPVRTLNPICRSARLCIVFN